MSEIADRVAAALAAKAAEVTGLRSDQRYWEMMARVAIAAIREPTPEMIAATLRAGRGFDGNAAEPGWRAAIAAGECSGEAFDCNSVALALGIADTR